MNLEPVLYHIIHSIRAYIGKYDRNKHLVKVYGGDTAYTDFLFQTRIYEFEILEKSNEKYPVIHTMEDAIYYLSIIDDKGLIYVIGPICTGKKASSNNESIDYMPYQFDLQRFIEEGLLLYNVLYEEQMTYFQVLERNYVDANILNQVQKMVADTHFNNYESGIVHNPYDQEKREMESIRQGNLEQLKRSIEEPIVGEYGVVARDDLRSSKNLGIVVNALATRAAIEGGIVPEVAYTLSDCYIRKIDEAMTREQVGFLTRSAEYQFASMVKEIKTPCGRNQYVEACKGIIYQNMHGNKKRDEIAKQLHIHPDYLASLFKKQEGITIGDYIMREKIKLAGNLLIYSEDTFEAVANNFGFASQSHFGKVFKKWTGFTPKQYRQKNMKRTSSSNKL